MLPEIGTKHVHWAKLRCLPAPATSCKPGAVLTVLALAMEADTHEVKKEAELPAWKKFSVSYRTNVAKLTAAMKAKNADEARALFAASNKACTECHAQFRD